MNDKTPVFLIILRVQKFDKYDYKITSVAAYNCIIIDDDEIDKLTTLSFARKYPFLNICGVCSSASEALVVIEKNTIDVLLSDIDMPDVNGLDFRRGMMNIPVCVFITSHPDFALAGFELAALDFLIKPLKSERFDACMKRVQEFLEVKQKAKLYEYSLGTDSIIIKDGHNLVKLKLHEIIYLEALKDYTLIVTSAKRYCVLSTIGNLLKEKNFQTFIRIHRSYAVQKNLVNSITPSQVNVNDIALPIGRSYKDDLEAMIW